MKLIALGWLLAFFGGLDLLIVGVVTVIRSLSVSMFVWTGGQTLWGIVGVALVVLGVSVFVGSAVKAVSD